MDPMRRVSRILQIFSVGALALLACASATIIAVVTRYPTVYRAHRVITFFRLEHSLFQWVLGEPQARTLASLFILLGVLPWLTSFHAGARIFGAFARGEAYRRATVGGVRQLGWALLSVVPLSLLFGPSLGRPIRWFIYVRPLPWLAAGVGLLVLASVLKEGCRLQDEQDLVV